MAAMTPEKTQQIVGLSALALLVLGPLSMILPVFFYTPLDRSSWWASLGVGLILALIPVAAIALASRRGLLDLPQALVGGGFLLVGAMTFTCGISLMVNGVFDSSSPTFHTAQVEDFWRDCAKQRSQNSTTTITTCRYYGSFSFEGGGLSIAGVEIPNDHILHPGSSVKLSMHSGAFGWRWGFNLEALDDSLP